MTRILLATHGGPSADGAVRVADRLAARLLVRLDVLAVVPPIFVPEGALGIGDPPEPEARSREDDARFAVIAQLGRCGVSSAREWAVDVVTGAVVPTIVDRARRLDTAVVVVGLGSHHVADRALGGETALRLAQEAVVPVLAVPPEADEAPRRAVAAIDFSPTSERAARTVARWLGAGGTLYLAHAMPAGGEADAADRLADFARTLEVPDGVRVEQILLSGTPSRALLEFERRAHCDLLALGSHGRGALRRLVLGSVGSEVLRHSTRAVLAIPYGSVAPPLPRPVESAAARSAMVFDL